MNKLQVENLSNGHIFDKMVALGSGTFNSIYSCCAKSQQKASQSTLDRKKTSLVQAQLD